MSSFRFRDMPVQKTRDTAHVAAAMLGLCTHTHTHVPLAPAASRSDLLTPLDSFWNRCVLSAMFSAVSVHPDHDVGLHHVRCQHHHPGSRSVLGFRHRRRRSCCGERGWWWWWWWWKHGTMISCRVTTVGKKKKVTQIIFLTRSSLNPCFHL